MKLIVAAQNEIIRRSGDESVGLATIGLISCVALIIKDKQGSASLAHIDSHTNLVFIKDELKRFASFEDISIYIVRNKSMDEKLMEDFLKAAKSNKPSYVIQGQVYTKRDLDYNIQLLKEHIDKTPKLYQVVYSYIYI